MRAFSVFVRWPTLLAFGGIFLAGGCQTSTASGTTTPPAGVACLGHLIPGEGVIEIGAPYSVGGGPSVVAELRVRRGDRVQAGQIIAVIESPEIDQQYNAAVTDLEHKRRNLARSQDLLAKGNTTQVAMLQFETDVRVAESNVKGLETMKGYQILRAPFAGRVTARYVDPGTLITNAQTNYVSALPIMTISDDSRLRVFCYVQQQDVPYINVGDVADIVDASNPERRMQAKVSRMTGELETRTRTMQIEINIDNTEGFLVAGSFANVTLHIPIKSYPQIPVSGLMVKGNDSFVAMIENDTLRYKPIRVQTTDGNTVTVAEGLRQGDRVAINLPDEITDGAKVQPILKK